MRKTFLIALALAAAPFAVQAKSLGVFGGPDPENKALDIYAWQDYSWEYLSTDDSDGHSRDFDRISGNLTGIGFAAQVDTGMNDIKLNFQCDSWSLYNHWHGHGGLCTQLSKISLSHEKFGEVMFAAWFLPHTWTMLVVDPFIGGGPDAASSIMGGIGGSSIYHAPGFWGNQRAFISAFNGAGQKLIEARPSDRWSVGLDTGINRLQEEIIQYISPNINGFEFRYAWTAGYEDELIVGNGMEIAEVDPTIRSASLYYANGPLWLGFAWQDHEDWSASRPGSAPVWVDAFSDHRDLIPGLDGTMLGSDTESFRLAGSYTIHMGEGAGINSIKLMGMWEDIEYEFRGVSTVGNVMDAFFPLQGFNGRGILDTGADLRSIYGIATTADMAADMAAVDAAEMATEGTNMTIERDAFMLSGVVDFHGPMQFRFSYMDADDLEVSCGICTGEWEGTAADAFNIGLFYALPSHTMLRVTYSEINNDRNGSYSQGITATGYGQAGFESEMFALGIQHFFD